MNTLLKRTIGLFALLIGIIIYLVIISNTGTTEGKILLMGGIGIVAIAFACIYWRIVRKRSLWRDAFADEVPSRYDLMSERKKGWILFAIMSLGCLLIIVLNARLIYLAAAIYGFYLMSVVVKAMRRKKVKVRGGEA
jgi:hypothetical protein